jgi:tetratricopeptide (TPR) repeat protein
VLGSLPRSLLAAEANARVKQEASRFIDRGNTLFDAKRYEQALAAYERAFAVYPSPRIGFNLAEAHRQLGHWAIAERLYRRFLENVKPAESSRIHQGIVARLDEMTSNGGRIAIAGDLTDAVVSIDGQALEGPPPRSILVPPGEHQVTVSRPSEEPFEKTIDVGQQETAEIEIGAPSRAQQEEAEASAEPPRAVPQLGVGEAALEAHLVEPEAKVESRRDESSSIFSRWWFWTLIGVAVTGGAVAGTVAITRGSHPAGDTSRLSEWQRF